MKRIPDRGYLPDANVWLGVCSSRHRFHQEAQRWLDSVIEPLVLCRAAQLVLLRLLSNNAVMRGEPLTQRRAWRVYEDLLKDDRISFQSDPVGIEAIQRRFAQRDEVAPNRWNDDHLAAFAEAAGLRLVTFDRAMAARVPGSVLLTE